MFVAYIKAIKKGILTTYGLLLNMRPCTDWKKRQRGNREVEARGESLVRGSGH